MSYVKTHDWENLKGDDLIAMAGYNLCILDYQNGCELIMENLKEQIESPSELNKVSRICDGFASKLYDWLEIQREEFAHTCMNNIIEKYGEK